jgi:anti-sigma factor RsiW
MVSGNDAACQESRDLTLGYIAESLSPAERASFEAHLAACPECRRYADEMRDAAYLSCQELVELVTDYLEGTLSRDEQARFERHLTICPGCETYLDQMRETIRLAGRLTEESIAPAARRDLLNAFRDWKRGERAPEPNG